MTDRRPARRLFAALALTAAGFLSLPAHAGSGSFDFVSDHDAKPEPSVQKPGLCESYTDPVFGTTITRMTDHNALGYSGVSNEYAKAEPYNADGSRLIVRSTSGHYLLLDNDCKNLGELPFSGTGEPRWSPSDPNVLRFVDKNAVKELNVATQAVTVLHTFPEYESVGTNDEGNWSLDYDEIALLGFSGGSPQDVFVYRASDDHVFTKFSLSGNMPGGLDWAGVSPSGDRVLIMFGTNDDWRAQGSAGRQLGYGLDSFDLNMSDRRRVQDHVHHGDICLSPNGEEAFVGSAANAPDTTDAHHIRMTKLADALPLTGSGTQATPFTQTSLITLDWNVEVHFSCRNIEQPGWVYISTYGIDSPGSTPFADELFAVSLDGSGEVRRLAQMHDNRQAYFEEPHGVTTFDGRAFLFTSNWGESPGSEAVDVYRVTIPGQPTGGDSSTGGGDPGSTQAGCSVGSGPSSNALGALLLFGLSLVFVLLRRHED